MNIKIPDKSELIFYIEELMASHSSPGCDNITPEEALNEVRINGDYICKKIESGEYKSKPVLEFVKIKKNGKERLLHKFCVLDNAIQKAIAKNINDSLNNLFSKSSFAFQKGKGVEDAVAKYTEYAKSHDFVTKIDPIACYDNIDRNVLYQVLCEFVAHPELISVISSFIYAPIIDETGISVNKTGILQGSPLSPALCNLYFHSLDKLLETKNIPFCRYADDIVAFANTEPEINDIADLIVRYVTEELKLKINTEKFKISKSEDIEFLGYSFSKVLSGDIIAFKTETQSKEYFREWTVQNTKRRNKHLSVVSDGILTRKDFSLLLETDEKRMIPIKEFECINVYSSVVVAPNVFKLAGENNLTINFFNNYGHLLGRFIPEQSFRDIKLPLLQLEMYQNNKNRTTFAKGFVVSSLHNIRINIRNYKKQYGYPRCDEVIEHLSVLEKKIKSAKTVNEILSLEAQMRGIYYSCFDLFIRNNDFEFEKRSKRPPMNEFNAMLSFGNTFLYNYIAMEINKTPLDIRIGCVHSATRRMESLNLDFADMFKPLIVDRTIFSLINRRAIVKKLHFEEENNGGVYLNKEGKKIFLEALYDKLDTNITVKDSSIPYSQIIKEEIRNFCRALKKNEKYKGFRQVR